VPRLPSASAARTSSARRSHPSRSGYGSLRLWPLSTSTSHTACHTVPQGHPPHTQVILHGVLSPESHPHRCRVDSPQIRNTPVEMYKSFAAWHAKAAQRKSRKDILRKTVSPKFRTGAHCLSRIFRCVSQVAGFRRALVLTKGIEKGDLIRRSPRGGPRLLSASPTRISSARRSHPSPTRPQNGSGSSFPNPQICSSDFHAACHPVPQGHTPQDGLILIFSLLFVTLKPGVE
jgi:hypothetical protein